MNNPPHSKSLGMEQCVSQIFAVAVQLLTDIAKRKGLGKYGYGIDSRDQTFHYGIIKLHGNRCQSQKKTDGQQLYEHRGWYHGTQSVSISVQKNIMDYTIYISVSFSFLLDNQLVIPYTPHQFLVMLIISFIQIWSKIYYSLTQNFQMGPQHNHIDNGINV